MSQPYVSIIICTRNRSSDLDRGLRIFANVDYHNHEIIVVDNSSDSNTIKKNKKSCGKIGARYIYEPRRGLSVARNRGILESRGKIVAFTDDDCIVDRNWLTNLTKGFDSHEVACCTGRTLNYYTDDLSLKFERYYSFDRGSTRRIFSFNDLKLNLMLLLRALSLIGERRITPVAPAPFSVGLGNNMIFRRDVFEEIGYFDEGLGRGTPSEAGEELDMFYRILKAGERIVYEPKAIVFHKHRQTDRELIEAVYTCGTGVAAFLKKHMKRGDLHAFLCYLGRLINLLVATTSYRQRGEKDATFLTSIELRGWIHGLFKY